MAHFAKLDDDNTVLNVEVVDNSVLDPNNTGTENENLGVTFLTNIHGWTNWKQTSYNNNFRKQFANKGFKYDATKDKFISIKPHLSWTLNSNDDWEAPVAFPTDLEFGDPVRYRVPLWNERLLRWDDNASTQHWDPTTSSWIN